MSQGIKDWPCRGVLHGYSLSNTNVRAFQLSEMRHTGNTVRPLYKTNGFALFSQRWIKGKSAGKTILCLRAQSMASCGCSLKPIYALYQIINRSNPIKPYLNQHFSSFPRYISIELHNFPRYLFSAAGPASCGLRLRALQSCEGARGTWGDVFWCCYVIWYMSYMM